MQQMDGYEKYCNLRVGEVRRVACSKGSATWIRNVNDFDTTYPCKDFGNTAFEWIKRCSDGKVTGDADPGFIRDEDKYGMLMVVLFGEDNCE